MPLHPQLRRRLDDHGVLEPPYAVQRGVLVRRMVVDDEVIAHLQFLRPEVLVMEEVRLAAPREERFLG